ncbi:hypothetical protein [Ferrovibrio terrae]|uniref:hypothetical protein n=1 Tax=Ferrovibrio terrae TaxID=2594003 RepID=UPI003137E2AF
MSATSVDSYIQTIIAALEQGGFSIFLEPDMGDWVRFIAAAPKNAGVNPTFDPRHHALSPADGSYWLRVMHDDRPAACIAFRRFSAPDGWIALLESNRIWSEYLTPLAPPRIVHPHAQNYRGEIGHHGGLWVHPDHRGRHLPYYLTHLVRARSVASFAVDHHCGIVFEGLKQSGLPVRTDGYEYERVDPSLEGFLQPVGRTSRMFTTHISRAGMLGQIAAGVQVFGTEKVRRAA